MDRTMERHKRIRADHLHRLRKILNREPGSSHTLDNKPPEVLQLKTFAGTYGHVRSELIYNENKALLKRIAIVLTAKPDDVEREYLELKKHYIPKCKSKKLLFEKALVDKRIKKFYRQIKHIKPYYKVKNWEDDYQKQAFNQKFMRKCNYKRPPGFVDPFLEPPQPVEVVQQPPKSQLSSAHVNRVRSMRQMRATSLSPIGENDSMATSQKSRSRRSVKGKDDNDEYGDAFEDDDEGNTRAPSRGAEGDYDGQEEDDEFYSETSEERIKIDLITLNRKVRVVKDVEPTDGQSKSNIIFFLDATVQCWMLDKEDVVISVFTLPDAANPESIEAEAEIDLQDLSAIRGGVTADSESDSLGENKSYSLADDLPALQSLARDIVAFVEIKVELDGAARVVLHLAHQFDTDTQSLTSIDASSIDPSHNTDDFSEAPTRSSRPRTSDDLTGLDYSDQRDDAMLMMQSLPPMTAKEGEIDSMLLEDSDLTVLSKGIRIPVYFVFNEEIANKVKMVEFMKRPSKPELLYALVKVQTNLSDDQLTVSVTVCSSSKFMVSIHRGNRNSVHKGKIKPAVDNGAIAIAQTTMPSIIYADPDMIHTFAQNVIQQLKVEHDCITGENKLILQT
eukprot:gene29046-38093_t